MFTQHAIQLAAVAGGDHHDFAHHAGSTQLLRGKAGVLRAEGHALAPASYGRWRRAISDAGATNPAFPLLAVLSDDPASIGRALPRVAHAQTQRALREAGLAEPRFGRPDFARMLARLRELGLRPLPGPSPPAVS